MAPILDEQHQAKDVTLLLTADCTTDRGTAIIDELIILFANQSFNRGLNGFNDISYIPPNRPPFPREMMDGAWAVCEIEVFRPLASV